MTFDNFEKSVDSGRPLELYEFQNGSSIWLFTSGDDAITVSSSVYNKENIERTKILQSQEGIRNQLTLTVRRDLPVAELYVQLIPLLETSVVVKKIHRDDPDQEVKIIWQGKIFDVKWPSGKASAEIRCDPNIGSQKSEGLRGRWQIRCNHTIYDEFCSLIFENLQTTLTVSALSTDGLTVTLPGLSSATPSADHWIGGLLKLGVDQFNMINSSSGDDIEIWRYMPDLTVGSTVQIGPGCQNLKSRCLILGNFENFLGAPDVPLKDIFTGDGLKGTVS